MMLRGPADADAYRVKMGRFSDRFYSDPLPADDTWSATPHDEAYPSISVVKKASGQDWSFVSLKRVAEKYKGQRLPPALDETYSDFVSANKNGLKAAQNRGTGVHSIAESYLKGYVDPMAKPNGDAEKYRAAVDAFFTTYRPELVACEFVAIHRTLNGVGYGGTGDAALRFTTVDGLLAVVDWKSRGEDSDHGAYAEEAAQVAGYARADYWIVEDEKGPKRIKPPAMDTGLIVSIKPDGFRVYPVDLDKAFEHWTSLHAWWVARRSEKAAIGRSWAPRKVEECPTPKQTESAPSPTTSEPSANSRETTASTSSELSTPTGFSTPPASLSDTRLDSIRQRIRALPDDAKPHLKRLWPADTPRGPSGPFTSEQLQKITAVLDTVEWEYTTRDLECTPGTGSASAPELKESSSPSLAGGEIFNPPEEGPDVDLTDTKARITALPKGLQEQFNTILVESKTAKRNFHLLANRGGQPSLRRVTIVNALVDALEASDGGEEMLRLMLGFALGEEVQPAVSLGCAVGSLTTVEAEKLSLLALALTAGTAHLTFSEGGGAVFGGTAAIVAA